MNSNLVLARALSERLVAARAAHRRAEHTLAVLLADLGAGEHFRPLGYVSVEDYAASVLDLTARHTRDLVRIGRALPRLPKLAAALEAGALDWTKARELVRVATASTEEAWIRRAAAVPSRVLELQVAGRSLGDLPPEADAPAAKAPALRRFVVQLESSDHDAVRAALAALRFDLGADADELEDGDLLARIVEQWIHLRSQRTEDQAPSTGERYRVTLEHCPECRRTESADAEISDTVAGEAACDAEVVDLRPGPTRGHVTQTVPPGDAEVRDGAGEVEVRGSALSESARARPPPRATARAGRDTRPRGARLRLRRCSRSLARWVSFGEQAGARFGFGAKNRNRRRYYPLVVASIAEA